MKRLGIDIGSTTIKCVVLNEEGKLIYSTYTRHYSHIKESVIKSLKELEENNILTSDFLLGISGSAAMSLANFIQAPFIQEVYATRIAASKYIPNTDCIIELGGEDAKILFLSDGLEVRMNGSCAGGTGAFIDQMSTLLNIDVTQINDISKTSEKIYNIASRCGVFAKTDIQPLLNQGANISDIAASIFKAVVNQTVGGLAQGRKITGNIAYLGGPLTFLDELRNSFNEGLNTQGICPENSLYYVAMGAGLCSDKSFTITNVLEKLDNYTSNFNYSYNEPLFKNEKELKEFRNRHAKNRVDTLSLIDYNKPLYLGIDSGSTTLKVVLVDEDLNIRYESYKQNKGNPITVCKEILQTIYRINPSINIKGACSTGYGEDLIKNAFNLDGGLVETMAHFTAAKKFMPNVDFIIDIGGQDIKCFKIEHDVISNIFLNEACSSGCGSFLQTFSNALGYEIEDFAKIGLLAKKPVDLGSRCTVFMNSSVKQAQKDGATFDNISAGLSISVVKNALYKVIRATNTKELGKNIIVQGGTFYNEAVLRAFERELDLEVIAPNISGLMGAYGSALYAMSLNKEKSSIISKLELDSFSFTAKQTKCGLCENRCSLVINSFTNGNRFISGNNCERPTTRAKSNDALNMYEITRNKLMTYKPIAGYRGKIAIPLVLNMYDLLPFWHTFFTNLGFEVHNSGFSTSKTYQLGQASIPSDTVCYPAKLVHGHIEQLINDGFNTIFYPSMSYNHDEFKGDNHYNCPVVAYYPEIIKNNVSSIKDCTQIFDYIGIHDKKIFNNKITTILNKYFNINKRDISVAALLAYQEYDNHTLYLRNKAKEIMEYAKVQGLQTICLAGRPYHIDPQINHGIDKLISSFNCAIVTQESISYLAPKTKRNVLNQWTYHARIYDAATYISTRENINLVQLVSFGCGLDAITTDEAKEILEDKNKIYTQLKIDEITNLGAVKIRLRSLFSAIENQKRGK